MEMRRTGKSTRAALDYIARAIAEPNMWIHVHDHAGFHHKEADVHLMKLISQIIYKLDLNMEVDIQRKQFKSLHTGFTVDKFGVTETIPLPRERNQR